MDTLERTPTDRQLLLLSMHAEGMTFVEIGREVHLSPRTVKADLRALRDMLPARSASHALAVCIGRGLLCVDGRTGKPFVPDQLDAIIAA